MYKKALYIFIFLSFITHPIGDYETGNVILRRVTFSDIFGALSILFGIPYIFKGLDLSLKINKIYLFGFILFLSFILPVTFSLNVIATLVESLILLFLILISILIFYGFKDSLLKLFLLIIYTVLTAAILGFYDIIAEMYGLPRLFRQRTNAELISGFRNAGQAGAYFMVFLAILFPLKYSELYKIFNKKQKILLNISLIMSVLFLFSTGKIAGWIGFAIGVFLFGIFSKKIKIILTVVVLGISTFFIYQNLDIIAPNLAKRLEMKVRTRIINQIEGNETNDNFFEKNWGGAVKAFNDNPFTGTGIGGFYGNYGNYEVHSTYLKMVGETGIVGVIGYLFFIISFIRLFKKPKKNNFANPYIDYLIKIFPFVIGCLVSWTYTYHIRKREFWIMVAILMIIKYQAKIYNIKYLKKFNKYERKNL